MPDRPTTPSRLVPILAFAVIATGLITGGVGVWLGVSGDETAEATVERTADDTSSTSPTTQAAPATTSAPPTTSPPTTAAETVETSSAPHTSADDPAEAAPVPEPTTFVFPVKSAETHYDSSHHDYPAADMFAPCGTPVVAVTDGTIEEVEAVDTYDSSNPDGGTKSGLMAALVDSRGVRYYGSHMSAVTVQVGDVVAAGDQIGAVGETGNAAGTGCHLHFGLSPACLKGWEHRRGHVQPQPFLDAWRTGQAIDPLDEVNAIACQ